MLSIAIFVFAFNVESIRAQSETITINPNGSISPSTANITTTDDVTYTFTGNNYLPIVVDKSNIIINGRGYTVEASGSNGFSLSGMNHVTIKNTTLTNNDLGIYLGNSSGDVLYGNNLTSNSIGVNLASSSDVTLSGNSITADSIGIYLDGSSENVLSGNNVANSNWGIYLDGSSENVLSGNNVTANGYGIALYSSSDNNTLSGNCLAANGVGVLLYSSSDNILSRNNVTSDINGYGVYLYSSSNNNNLRGNEVTANWGGIGLVFYSDDNTLFGNNVSANSWIGVYLDYSSDNTLSNNNVAQSYLGVNLESSSDNALSGNNITANSYYGIQLVSSSANTFCNNNFMGNSQQVESDGSPNTWDNGYSSGGNYWSDYQTRYAAATEIDNSGMWNMPYIINANNTDYYPLINPYSPTALSVGISPSSATWVFGQSELFCSSVFLGTPPYKYQWYLNGTPVSGATYSTWNFLEPVGSYSVYVNVTDSLGITAKSNIASVKVKPVVYAVGISMNVPSKTIVGQGYSLNGTFTVANLGDLTETLNVTVYANTIAIATQRFTLAIGNSTIITFAWNTKGFAYGSYTISANVTITGEMTTGFVYGTVKVTIPGDVNGDGIVNIKDGALIGEYWGMTVPPAPANVDVGGFGVINIRDGAIVGANWGRTT
jgi:parallel beta-helix repeat protein